MASKGTMMPHTRNAPNRCQKMIRASRFVSNSKYSEQFSRYFLSRLPSHRCPIKKPTTTNIPQLNHGADPNHFAIPVGDQRRLGIRMSEARPAMGARTKIRIVSSNALVYRALEV